jgi:hypothetical protein
MKFRPSLKSAKSLALAAVTIATAIAASNVTSTLAQTTSTPVDLVKNAPQKIAQDSTRPTTRPGSIVFTNNNSNLMVGFQVKYMLDGKPQTYQYKNSEGRDFSFGPQTAIFNIPPQATNVVVVSQRWRFVVPAETISEQSVNPSSKTCFTIEYMAPFAPTVNNTCTVATTPPPPPAPAPLPPIRLPALASVPPDVIVTYPNHASLAIFNSSSEAFLMACPAVRDLWRGVGEQQAASREEYFKLLSFKPTRFGQTTRAADLYCNSPSQVQGYVSPAFAAVPGRPAYAGAIVVKGKTYMLNNPEFFGAMGIKPTLLNEQQARDLMNNATFGFTNLTIKR